MSQRLIFLIFILSAFVEPAGAGAPFSCSLALDALVGRAGSAQIAAPVADVRSSGISLSAVGTLSVGGTRHSVWLIRNFGALPEHVVLRASVLMQSALTVPPHSDLFIRSEDTRNPHVLLAGGVEIDRRSPLASDWHDARAVPDPLCSEPGTTLWVQRAGAVMRVSPIDGRVLFEIPTQSVSAPFAVDAVDGSVWIWDASLLRHIDLWGSQRTQPVAPLLALKSAVLPQLAVDSLHRLWLASGRELYRTSEGSPAARVATLGQAVLRLVPDAIAHILWLVSIDRVSAWPIAENGAAPATVTDQWSLPALRIVASDTFAGGLWVVVANQLRNYDASGQIRTQTWLPNNAVYTAAAGDSKGGVWLAGPHRLSHYGANGAVDVSAAAPALILPFDIAIDAHAATVWVSSAERLSAYSETGAALPINGNDETLAPAAGLVFAATRLLEGVRSFADITPPQLQFVAPAEGAVLNIKRPAILLQAGDREGHVVPASLALEVNGLPQAMSCASSAAEATACSVSRDLPEGRLLLKLSASDDSGNMSTVSRGITVDTVPPSLPASASIHVAPTSADAVSISSDPASVEAGATIHVRNVRSGESAEAPANAVGAFSLIAPGTAGDAFDIFVRDPAGNTSAVLRVTASAPTPTFDLQEPLEGVVTSEREIVVRGSLSTDTGGISVNGRPVALLAASGAWTFATRVALSPGANTIDAVAHLSDGSELHAPRTVTLINPEPFGVRVSAQAGVAPFEARFSINAFTDLQATNVEIDFDSDGETDTVGNAANERTHTYANAGAYTALVVVTAADGSRYRFEVPVTVLSPDSLDQRLKLIWNSFVASLSAGDPASAASLMEPDLAERLTPILADLRQNLSGIASSLSNPVLTSASPTMVEYVITRTIGTDVRAFTVYFRLDADGLWRLASI